MWGGFGNRVKCTDDEDLSLAGVLRCGDWYVLTSSLKGLVALIVRSVQPNNP
jgi:hypothetical protein